MNAIQKLKQILNDSDIWDRQNSLVRWEYIKKNDSIDTNLYFVEKGCIRVFFLEGEHEHSLYFGFEGSLISALDSFFSGKASPIAIQCLNNTTVNVISKAKFYDFIENDPSLNGLWQEVLSELSLWHHEREKDLMINSPLARYERILSRHPQLFQKVPHKYIASYLRMTPETLSRLLNS